MTDQSAMTDGSAAAPAAAAAAPAAAAPAEPAKPSGKSPFEIKKWSPVFMWSWDVESDTCSICRGNLNELCLECQTKPTGGECTVAWGVCNVCLTFFFLFHNFSPVWCSSLFALFLVSHSTPSTSTASHSGSSSARTALLVCVSSHTHFQRHLMFTTLPNADNTEWEYLRVSK